MNRNLNRRIHPIAEADGLSPKKHRKGTFPSIPLMKISAYHKSCGDLVDWYYPFNGKYDKVYLSKVFSFSQDYIDCIDADEIVRGGTCAIACMRTNRHYLGFELDKKYFDLTKERIRMEKQTLRLF